MRAVVTDCSEDCHFEIFSHLPQHGWVKEGGAIEQDQGASDC